MPEFRNTLLSARLTSVLFDDIQKLKVEKLVISGVESQVRLYRHIGFMVVGEPVQDGKVLLYPLTGDIKVVQRILSRAFSVRDRDEI